MFYPILYRPEKIQNKSTEDWFMAVCDILISKAGLLPESNRMYWNSFANREKSAVAKVAQNRLKAYHSSTHKLFTEHFKQNQNHVGIAKKRAVMDVSLGRIVTLINQDVDNRV